MLLLNPYIHESYLFLIYGMSLGNSSSYDLDCKGVPEQPLRFIQLQWMNDAWNDEQEREILNQENIMLEKLDERE